jgi:hypothetical protein
MAGPNLERLRAQKSQKRVVGAPSKPSKLDFEGFEGDQSGPFLEINRPVEAADAVAKNEKRRTLTNPQNLQNLHAPSVPTAAYQAVSVEPDGATCKVEIVELPAGGRYRKVFAVLQLKPPALIDIARRQCVQDGSKFLARWGEQAHALGWTSADLFGLHSPPANPHPSYRRLSRYDATGLCWLLEGREVVALTEATASIRNPDTGAITTYRRFNKPALGP